MKVRGDSPFGESPLVWRSLDEFREVRRPPRASKAQPRTDSETFEPAVEVGGQAMQLNVRQRDRYARQIALPEIGPEGQRRLLAGRVLVVGLGGLGSPAVLYLAAAGVGTLGLADGDRVEISNLQRQIVHATDAVGKRKVDSAAARCRNLNPDVSVRPHAGRLDRDGAKALFQEYDFVIDATDNFATKTLISDVCHALGVPYSHAGIRRYEGQTLTVIPGSSACWRCVFREFPCEEDARPQGPLGVVPGIVGTIQAAEAIKSLLGLGALLTNRLLTVDVLTMKFREVSVRRDPECPCCGTTGKQPRQTSGG